MLAAKTEKKKIFQAVMPQRIKTDCDKPVCKGESFETGDTIVLSETASTDFWENIENPPEPNEYLKEAVKAYRGTLENRAFV